MVQRQTLRYDLSAKGALDFPPPQLDRKLALEWVTKNTNRTLGLSEAPDLTGQPEATDAEAAFLLYYLFKHGDADANMTELHLLVPIGRPADGKVPTGYVVLRYMRTRAAAALVKRATATLTSSPSAQATGKAIESLRSEFGLGSVQAEGGAAWTDADIKKVRAAMTWLPQPHRVVLRGMTLVRVKVPTNPQEAGHFTWDTAGKNRLELSDKAFERDEVRFKGQNAFVPAAFVGGVARVGPLSLNPILHELGHAVEVYGLRTEATNLKAASDAAFSKYEAVYGDSQALQRQWSEAKARGAANTADLAAAWKVKDAEAEAAKSLFQEAERLFKKRSDEGSLRLSQFTEPVAERDIPITSYAASSNREFFAEAYAAWRADPEFLETNAPATFEWFEALSKEQP